MTTITESIGGGAQEVQLLTLTRLDNGAAVALSPPLPQDMTCSGNSFTYTFTDPSGDCLVGYSYTFAIYTGISITGFGANIVVGSTSSGGPAPLSTPLEKFQVIVPPAATPVLWQDAVNQLRLDSNFDSDYVNLLICAATDYAQDSLEMSLMPQTIAAVFNAEDVELSPPVSDYPWDPLSPLGTPLGTPSFATWGTFNRAPVIKLPRGPVQSIISVVDGSGTAITAFSLERTPCGDRIRFMGTASYPLIVTYVAGYASASAIPAGIRVAILTHVGTLYGNRASANALGAKVVPHSLEAFYRLKGRRTIGG